MHTHKYTCVCVHTYIWKVGFFQKPIMQKWSEILKIFQAPPLSLPLLSWLLQSRKEGHWTWKHAWPHLCLRLPVWMSKHNIFASQILWRMEGDYYYLLNLVRARSPPCTWHCTNTQHLWSILSIFILSIPHPCNSFLFLFSCITISWHLQCTCS